MHNQGYKLVSCSFKLQLFTQLHVNVHEQLAFLLLTLLTKTYVISLVLKLVEHIWYVFKELFNMQMTIK